MIKDYQVTQVDLAEEWIANCIRSGYLELEGETSKRFFRKVKALCELSFLEYCVSNNPSKVLRAELSSHLVKMMESSKLLSLIRHNLEHSALFVPILIAYCEENSLSPEQAYDVETLVRLIYRHSKERLPFRQLDVLHGLYRLTGDHFFYEELLARAQFTSLGKPEYPFDISPQDDYAITHTIFYVTDFGRQPWPSCLPPTPVIEDILDSLSYVAETDENLDLLAEYAMCRQYLQCKGGRLDEELKILRSNQNGEGIWFGPADLSAKLASENFEKSQYCFYQNYHTSLLAKHVLQEDNESLVIGTREDAVGLKQATTRGDAKFSFIKNRTHLLLPEHREIYNGFTQLWYQIDGKSQELFDWPSDNKLTNPETILHYVELLYWLNRVGLKSEDFTPAIEGLLNLNVLDRIKNERFVTIWSLAANIAGRDKSPEVETAIIEEITSRPITHKRSELTGINSHNDLVVAACLLYDKAFKAASRKKVWQVVSRSLQVAMLERDFVGFTRILPFALELDCAPERLVRGWREYFHSMSSKSLPYGWTTRIQDNQKSSSVLELYYMQSCISLRINKKL